MSELTIGSPPPFPPGAPVATPVNRRRWWFHLVVIGIYPPVIGLLGAAIGHDNGPVLTHNVAGLLRVCGKGMLEFALWFFLGWYASRATWDDLLLRWRNGVWTVPLGLAYSIVIRLGTVVVAIAVIVVLMISQLVNSAGLSQFLTTDRSPVETLVDVSALRDNPVYFWLATSLVSFVVAGFREELWRSAVLAGMRKLWPTAFGAGAGQLGAVAVAAVLFGLGHLTQGYLGVMTNTVVGFGLGLIMVYHRSIWPAVIAHGAFDATSIAFAPWLMEKAHQLHPH